MYIAKPTTRIYKGYTIEFNGSIPQQTAKKAFDKEMVVITVDCHQETIINELIDRFENGIITDEKYNPYEFCQMIYKKYGYRLDVEVQPKIDPFYK